MLGVKKLSIKQLKLNVIILKMKKNKWRLLKKILGIIISSGLISGFIFYISTYYINHKRSVEKYSIDMNQILYQLCNDLLQTPFCPSRLKMPSQEDIQNINDQKLRESLYDFYGKVSLYNTNCRQWASKQRVHELLDLYSKGKQIRLVKADLISTPFPDLLNQCESKLYKKFPILNK